MCAFICGSVCVSAVPAKPLRGCGIDSPGVTGTGDWEPSNVGAGNELQPSERTLQIALPSVQHP